LISNPGVGANITLHDLAIEPDRADHRSSSHPSPPSLGGVVRHAGEPGHVPDATTSP